MLIKSTSGSEFHIVDPAQDEKKFYVCLCGAHIGKNCKKKQFISDRSYTRCWHCKVIEHTRWRSQYPI